VKKRCLSIGLTLLLVACGSSDDAAAPAVDAAVQAGVDAEAMPVMGPERHILAFGDSLFAGYGVAPEDSYPAKLQRALRAQGVNAQVANAGVSGDTTQAGLQRFPFVLDSQPQAPDLVIVELGGNDLLRGLSPEQTRANLQQILGLLEERGIPVLLMGMRAPPNMGEDYQRAFDRLYGDLAKAHGAALVPFFLEAVYDRPELIQSDRIHPTSEGIAELVADTADEVVAALPKAN